MNDPNSNRRKAEELIQRVVSLTAEERRGYLDEDCRDKALRAEVEKLLDHDRAHPESDTACAAGWRPQKVGGETMRMSTMVLHAASLLILVAASPRTTDELGHLTERERHAVEAIKKAGGRVNGFSYRDADEIVEVPKPLTKSRICVWEEQA